MEDDSDYSTSRLEHCSYRYLQQLAKAMLLPSNVKKIHLVEMINAKKCSPEAEVQRLVRKVKQQRKHSTQAKKKRRRVPIPPDTSSDEAVSPPITNTPKRPAFTVRSSELSHQIMHPENTTGLLRTSKPVTSDRVLRSCNVKTVKRTYVNTYSEITERQAMVDQGTQMNVMRVVRKYKPNIISSALVNTDRQLVPVTQDGSTQMLVKRRLPGGMWGARGGGLQVGGVGVRAGDGRLAALNAYVTHEPREPRPAPRSAYVTHETRELRTAPRYAYVTHEPRELRPAPRSAYVAHETRELRTAPRSAYVTHDPRASRPAPLNTYVTQEPTPAPSSTGLEQSIELTIQDIINGNVDAQAASLYYPNTTGVTETDTPEYTETSPETSSAVYYHKKIRAERVRARRMNSVNSWFEPRACPERCELPPIGAAFGQFGLRDPRDVTRPIYVQVGEEAERMHCPQVARSSCLLETVYNFRSQFLTAPPLLQPAPPADTKCVYSTTIMPTALPHRLAATTEPYVPSYEPDYQYNGNTGSPRVGDYPKFPTSEFDFRCHEEQNTSGSSVGTAQSQELGANVTISDMVEDALELISQDGDYMERMGMDLKAECVLCNWAGPKMILEYHIRKEHSSEIDHQEKREWNITYTLASVWGQEGWRSRVVSLGAALYVLRASLRPPARLRAALASLSPDPELTSASITVFNKVSGEPFSWFGEVHELPCPPDDSQPGLQVDLADLDLMPNSANLKLLNGELVPQSPNKVVMGPLELNDIHIIIFVKLSE